MKTQRITKWKVKIIKNLQIKDKEQLYFLKMQTYSDLHFGICSNKLNKFTTCFSIKSVLQLFKSKNG